MYLVIMAGIGNAIAVLVHGIVLAFTGATLLAAPGVGIIVALAAIGLGGFGLALTLDLRDKRRMWQ